MAPPGRGAVGRTAKPLTHLRFAGSRSLVASVRYRGRSEAVVARGRLVNRGW